MLFSVLNRRCQTEEEETLGLINISPEKRNIFSHNASPHLMPGELMTLGAAGMSHQRAS